MPSTRSSTVADVEGPWTDPNFESGLIDRCRRGWNTPVGELTDELLATYLRQRIALALVVPEAEMRIAAGRFDDTEMYDGELANALRDAKAEA
jgi:hypothetical protein